MQFLVKQWRHAPPLRRDVVLTRDNWDDYGFKTLFSAEFHVSPGDKVDLRGVKILKQSQESGLTPIASSFTTLDDTYYSLGQELSYYESLLELPDRIGHDYLSALRDAAANPAIVAQFKEESGFGTSLLRSGAAARALEDAPALLQGRTAGDEPLEFVFHTRFGTNEFGVSFRFRQIEGRPGRMPVKSPLAGSGGRQPGHKVDGSITN